MMCVMFCLVGGSGWCWGGGRDVIYSCGGGRRRKRRMDEVI